MTEVVYLTMCQNIITVTEQWSGYMCNEQCTVCHDICSLALISAFAKIADISGNKNLKSNYELITATEELRHKIGV